MRSIESVAIGLILGSAVLAGQQRDRPAAPSGAAVRGTASVSGTVTVAVASEEIVSRAIVTLHPAAGGDGTAVLTDDKGRFSFINVTEGRYTLVAQKAAHLTTAYGAKRPGRPGVTLVIAKGQVVSNLALALPRGGVIAGRVSDVTGSPARNAQVLAIPIAEAEAGGFFDTRSRAFFTDDQGEYRMWGLAPGDYLVTAIPEQGRLAILERTPEEWEEWTRLLSAKAAGSTAPRLQPRPLGYAPTYYPGTPIAAAAGRVRIASNEVRDGIDIPITLLPMATISGAVRGVGGEITQAIALSLEHVGPPLPISAAVRLGSRRPDSDGRFAFSNLPPGTYRLTARAGGVTFRDGGVEIDTREQKHWAMTTVVVNGEDVEGVSLSLQPGLTLSGRVEASSVVALKGTTISLTPLGQGTPPARSGPVGDDGTFTVTGLHPATWDFSVTLPASLASTWGVQSIKAGGRELRDTPLTLEPGSIGDIVVALTDKRTEVAGTLTSGSGAPATDYFVVLFPSERAMWHAASPRVRVVRPSADGSFRAQDLPAGDYRIAALTDVEDDEWRRPAFLESIFDASVAIIVKDGTKTRQDLRIQ